MNSTNYPYEEDGILPDGSKVPDIPVMNLLIVRKDRRKGLLGESIIDTGFDAAIYANLSLAEFLEGATPKKTMSLQAAGREVTCEVFDVECYITNRKLKPVFPLGQVDAYCPVDPIDLSEDVIIGRAILNRIRLQLNGRVAKLFLGGSTS